MQNNTSQCTLRYITGYSFVLLMIISLSPTAYRVLILCSFMISLPVDLLINTVNCVITLYAVDTLCNNNCWVLFCCHQTEFTHKYICIYTKTTHFLLPFEECALLLFYILYINIYKEAFCKWTSIAYMLVRTNSPL